MRSSGELMFFWWQVEYLRNYQRLQDKTYERQFPVKYSVGTARKLPNSRIVCKVYCFAVQLQ